MDARPLGQWVRQTAEQPQLPQRTRRGVWLAVLLWALFGALLGATTVHPRAQAQGRTLSAQELGALLERVQHAASQLDYAGTFTWQQGAQLQSSRIVHVVDATGERERIEVLDGPAREFIRHNDVVQCIVPGEQLVLVENRRSPRFPGLQFIHTLNRQADLARRYTFARVPPRQRVAGRSCTQIDARPKDALRFGQRMCVDDRTGLLLKVQTLDARGQVIEQIGFTSLQLGQKVYLEQLAPSWDTRGPGWKTLHAGQDEIDAAQLGWHLPLPAGFRYVTQMSRPTRSGPPMMHLVLADGLSAISVFIEAHQGRRQPPVQAKTVGAVGVHGVRVGDHWLTMVGEVPLPTLKTLADQVRYAPPAVAPRQAPSPPFSQ